MRAKAPEGENCWHLRVNFSTDCCYIETSITKQLASSNTHVGITGCYQNNWLRPLSGTLNDCLKGTSLLSKTCKQLPNMAHYGNSRCLPSASI